MISIPFILYRWNVYRRPERQVLRKGLLQRQPERRGRRCCYQPTWILDVSFVKCSLSCYICVSLGPVVFRLTTTCFDAADNQCVRQCTVFSATVCWVWFGRQMSRYMECFALDVCSDSVMYVSRGFESPVWHGRWTILLDPNTSY